ncbi:hypothetical protein HY469_04915, partial [Candidatus Roizmanbacteria bacterium]|nr:hypothetical protein [Candidatus Roizmanbacteria bacterium]
TEEETASFAQRVLDKKYLYTPSGPVITEAKNPMKLKTTDYHGTVIWPKTTGFTVLGLYKQLLRARKNKWNNKSIQLIEKAIKETIYNSIRAYIRRGGVPELYYDKNGEPMNFNEQMKTSEESSQVQLWSAMSYIAMLDIAERMGI